MSITSELERLTNARDQIRSAIAEKGVAVPEGARLDTFPALVQQISVGGEQVPIMTVSVNGQIGEELTSETTYQEIRDFMVQNRNGLVFVFLTESVYFPFWMSTIINSGAYGQSEQSILGNVAIEPGKMSYTLIWTTSDQISVSPQYDVPCIHLDKDEDGTYSIREHGFTWRFLVDCAAYTTASCLLRVEGMGTTYVPFGWTDNKDGTWTLRFRNTSTVYGSGEANYARVGACNITGTSDTTEAQSIRSGLQVQLTNYNCYGMPNGGEEGQVLTKTGSGSANYGWRAPAGSSRVFEQVLNQTGTTRKGNYNFSKTIEIKPGDVFLVETIRENAFSYQNIIVAKGDSTTEIIMCVPMGNSGANIFAQVTITATALSVNTDWYSGYEYTGILSQTLCTGIRVWHISY